MARQKEKKDTRKKGTKKQIAKEIQLQIGRCVFAILLLVSLVFTGVIGNETMMANKEKLQIQSQSAGWQIADFFDQYISITEQLAVNPQIMQLMEETEAGDDVTEEELYQTVFDYMKSIADKDENLMAVWLGDIDANLVTQSDKFTSGPDYEITERAWYYCIAEKKTILTEPYVDSSTGQTIVSAVSPVYLNGKAMGVTGVDLALTHVSEVMQNYKIGDTGYVTLLSEEGVILSNQNEDWVLKKLSEVDVSDNVVKAVEEKSTDFICYQAGFGIRFGYPTLVGDSEYMVLSALPLKEYIARFVICVLVVIAMFILAAILILKSIKSSANKITKPLEVLNHTALQLAEGDLDVEIAIDVENEIGTLGNSIGKTVDRLKEYIVYIDEISEVLGQMALGKLKIELQNDYVGEFAKVKEALENISASMIEVMQGIFEGADQVLAGSDDLASASQMLAEGAADQTMSIETLVEASADVSNQVVDNRMEAEKVAGETSHVAEMMETNQQLMNQMVQAMEKIMNTSTEVVGIIKSIEEIADQTNLLSLNASIEAARAGAAGRGFAVVADEIGHLADESAKSANNTRELIHLSMQEIDFGNELAEKVMISLREAVKAVENVKVMSEHSVVSATKQEESIEQIKKGIEQISQGISDNSAVAQESSATSEELAAQATTLNDLIRMFEF